MNLMKSLQQVRLTLVVLAIASAVLMSAAIFRASTVPADKGEALPTPCGAGANLNEQVRRGVGSAVRFASSKASEAQVTASVESVADFIYKRSSLRMSDETKKR